MSTRIIVDSTADLLPEYQARVNVVPLTVHFGEQEYIDGEINMLGKAGGVDFSKPVPLGYSGLSDALLLKYIEDSRHIWDQGIDAARYTTIGSVIGTHAGPGAVTVAFCKN